MNPSSRSSLRHPAVLPTSRIAAWLLPFAIGSMLGGCRVVSRVRRALGDTPTANAIASTVQVVSLSLGNTHSCARLDDGTIRCWGGNELGQLGDGTNNSRDRGIEVPGIEGADQIAAGADRSCARLHDGRVRCWGADWDTLSDGRLSPEVVSDPSDVAALSGLDGLALYHRRTCALSHGEVRCMRGSELLRALPSIARDGAVFVDATVPEFDPDQPTDAGPAAPSASVRIPGLRDVVELAMGDAHSCARSRDGAVRCWGNNQGGQLGADPVYVTISAPTLIGGLTGVRAIAAAGAYTCAIVDAGAVRCWGTNPPGLPSPRDGHDAYFRTPTAVAGLADVTQLALSSRFACARLGDATVRCWGDNEHGQLGDGSLTRRESPVAVRGLTDIAEIRVGTAHACARLGDGTVRCWGRNENGEVGDGSRVDRHVPAVTIIQP